MWWSRTGIPTVCAARWTAFPRPALFCRSPSVRSAAMRAGPWLAELPLPRRCGEIDGWVVIGLEPGLRQLAFQRVTQWVPPRWPDPAHPQQLHLDIRVRDADQAEQELLTLGATRVPGERETGFRVFTDPPVTRSASSSAVTAQPEQASAH